MNLQARKISFVQEFLKIQSEEIVIRLERILEKELKRVPKNDISPMSLDEFNQRIEKSLQDSINGRLTENSDLIREIQRWI